MDALDITGPDGRPAPVPDTLVVLMVGVRELLERGAEGDRTLKSDLMLVALPRVRAGSRAARAVPGWKTIYPLDDPANEPDQWIRIATPIVWIKRDDHEPYKPADGRCSWCGRFHTGVMAIFTVLLPEEY